MILEEEYRSTKSRSLYMYCREQESFTCNLVVYKRIKV